MQINQPNKILFLFSLSLILLSCSDNSVGTIYPPDNFNKVTISQGVWGNVWFWEGNFMPSTDNSSNGKIIPVIREIYVYEATRFDSVEKDSSNYVFIRSIYSNLITKVNSDKDGFFQVTLPVGRYSFFVKEDSLFFANESDGDGYLMSAEVNENKVTKRQIDINYKAAY
jgi:hypothetical protein